MMRALSTIAALLFLLPCFGQGQSGRPMVSVDTVADLVARNPVPNERVILTGWRTNGYFGAPRILRHDPSSVAATNLGCVYANAGSGRYIADDCEGGEYDVRWSGAPTDGVTDATAAIADAVGTANRTIKFPLGSYLITTQVSLASNIKIVGPGTIVAGVANDLFGAVFYATNQSFIELDGLRAISGAGTNILPYLLRADLTPNVTVRNCVVTNMGLLLVRGYLHPSVPDKLTNVSATIESYDTTKQQNIKVIDNTCIGTAAKSSGDFTDPHESAVRIDYALDVMIRGNVVRGYMASIWGTGGLVLWLDESSGIVYADYAAGRIPTATSSGSKRVSFVGNTVEDVQIGPWYYCAQDVVFSGNTVGYTSDVGITLDGIDGGVVSGNVVRNSDAGYIWVGAACRNISVVGNTARRDDVKAGVDGFPRAIFLAYNGGGGTTNAVISGNTFVDDNTVTNNAVVQLSYSYAGSLGLVYSGNYHRNVYIDGLAPGFRDVSIRDNIFVRTTEMPDDTSLLTLSYAFSGNLDVSGNSFLWRAPSSPISAVSGTLTLSSGTYTPTTGDRVRYWSATAVIPGITNGGIYYVNAATTNTVYLYDSLTNAITGGPTGLFATTNLSFDGTSVVYPEIMRDYEHGNAVQFLKVSGGDSRQFISAAVKDNLIDWPSGIEVRTQDTLYSGNETNFTGYFIRNTSPIQLQLEGNTFGYHYLTVATMRHDEIGGSGNRIHYRENSTWNGLKIPSSVPVNVIVGRWSPVFDNQFRVNKKFGMVAGYDGIWANSLGLTNWVATNYVAGDLVFSNGRTYVAVIDGTSADTPTGAGDANGYLFDSAGIVWANLGSIIPVVEQSMGQVGHRTWNGLPYGNLTPNFDDEVVLDTAHNQWWRSTNRLNTSWLQILSPPSTNGAYVLFVTNGVGSWIAYP